jgi:uncharacterized protein DUF3268
MADSAWADVVFRPITRRPDPRRRVPYPDPDPASPVQRDEQRDPSRDRWYRHLGHREFDQLWKPPTRVMSRHQAYQWLARAMGLTEEEAHFARFDARQCQVALGAVRLLRAELLERPAGR